MNALQTACDTIREKVLSGSWAQGQKLPTLADLASLCDISPSTMWRALGLLKKESLIHGKRGGSLIAGPAGVSRAQESGSKGPAWRRLKERIGQEILIGTSWETELPPINKLAQRYGVAIDTCKKALNELVRNGLLSRDGRRFHKTFGRLKHYRSGIVLIASGDHEKGILITEPRIEHVVESFERECFRLGFQSRCEGYNTNDPSALIRMSARLAEIEPVNGYIISLWNPGQDTAWNRWLDLLQSLLTRGNPVIVLDQDGGLIFPQTLLAQQQFRVLRIAGLLAGEMVGQMFLRQGHRHVAFLMPLAQSQWTQNRFTGLLQCYKQYGGPEATVERYAAEKAVDTDDLILAVLGLGEKEVRAVYRKRLSSDGLQELAGKLHKDSWIRLKEKIPADTATESTEVVARLMTDAAARLRDPWVYNTMMDTLIHISSNVARDRYITTFLDTVLQKSNATAWVCAEDIIALNAVSFLRSKGKRVPEDISVIGFENYRESHEQQLSTLDFNMNGMVQQALTMIIDEKSLKSKPAVSEVDGYVVERRTTRR